MSAAFSVSATAQDEWILTPSRATSPIGITDVNANFRGRFFFKNNEYFSDYEEGYTLIGYQLRPTVSLEFADRLTVTGGLQALQYGGMDHFHKVWPFFSAQAKFGDGPFGDIFTLTLGNLPGPESHKLHMGLQNPEDAYTSRPELGAQAQVNTEHWSGHAWVNWRQYIFLGDSIPEKFSAGVSGTFFFTETARWKTEMPVAAVFDHIGGQISNYPDTLQSMANLSISPTLWRLNRGGRFINRVGVRLNGMLFHSMAGGDVRPFSDGWALHAEVKMVARWLRAEVGWWRSQDFWSPHGLVLLSSLSNYKDDVYTKNRSVLTQNLALCFNVTQYGRMSVEFDGYYDTFEARYDYTYGIHFAVDLNTPRSSARMRRFLNRE